MGEQVGTAAGAYVPESQVGKELPALPSPGTAGLCQGPSGGPGQGLCAHLRLPGFGSACELSGGHACEEECDLGFTGPS